jgi:hypothetical protein
MLNMMVLSFVNCKHFVYCKIKVPLMQRATARNEWGILGFLAFMVGKFVLEGFTRERLA